MSQQDTSKVSTAHFAIEGEMTIYRAAELREVMLHQIKRADVVELDLSQITEIDSSGLQLLVAAKLEATRHNRQLHFVGHSKPVLEVIDLCDLSGFFGDQIVIDPHTSH
jgi:anti-anti-sigma factor